MQEKKSESTNLPTDLKAEQALGLIGLGLMQKMSRDGETLWNWSDEENGEKELEKDPFEKSFSKAMESFILHIAEDPQAKESVVAAFGDNKTFLKPTDISVREPQERIAVLCHYVNQLPGTRGKLSPAVIEELDIDWFI